MQRWKQRAFSPLGVRNSQHSILNYYFFKLPIRFTGAILLKSGFEVAVENWTNYHYKIIQAAK